MDYFSFPSFHFSFNKFIISRSKSCVIRKSLISLLFLLTIHPHINAGKHSAISVPAMQYNGSYTSAPDRPFFHSGFFSLTEANLAFGLSGTGKPYSERFFGINTIAGYQFNSAIFIGAGAGMADYNAGQMLPVFLHGRYYSDRKDLKPFVSGDVGLLYHVWGEETNKRIFTNPAAGVSVKVSDFTTLTFAIGFFTQWERDVSRDSFLNLKFGLAFF